MLKVGITGAYGLLGWHLRCMVDGIEGWQDVPAGRDTFANESALDDFVNEVDVIVHLAGMNRGDDAELEQTNISLAQLLVGACERQKRTPHIIYSSSTHIDRDSAYGRSKKRAGEIIGEWAERNGALFSNLVLPHIYGEGGKPFYNSVVSTFCYQIANHQTPKIDNDGQLELLHAQDAAQFVHNLVLDGKAGTFRVEGEPLKVSEMLKKVQSMHDSYRIGLIPDLRKHLDLRLFNTLRSYLYPDAYPVPLKLHTDPRGSLFEAVKSDNGGQSFLSTTVPGITRGNHYHRDKVERFLVVKGEAIIRIRRLFSDDVLEFPVRGDQPRFVDMPTLHTHSITNTGTTELLTLFWSHEVFDPENPDTYVAQV